MDIDEIERVLVGDDVTGTEAWVALGLLIVGLVLYFVVGSALRRTRSRWKQDVIPGETLDVGIKLVQILILVIFVGWSLGALGASVRWLTIIVIAVLVIGVLVAKPVIESLATSVIVATRTAFTVGDQIEVDRVVGEIERVANRSTVLRTRDGKRVHIPNSELIDKTVTVYTAYEERRSSIDVNVALDTDLDVVDTVVYDTLAAVGSVNRVGSIRVRSFSEGVILSIQIWHGPRLPDGRDAVDAALRHLKVAFEQAGIRFAPATSIQLSTPPPSAGKPAPGNGPDSS